VVVRWVGDVSLEWEARRPKRVAALDTEVGVLIGAYWCLIALPCGLTTEYYCYVVLVITR
jgi:hypothetical protein